MSQETNQPEEAGGAGDVPTSASAPCYAEDEHETCRTCKHWSTKWYEEDQGDYIAAPRDDCDMGHCHRYAPRPVTLTGLDPSLHIEKEFGVRWPVTEQWNHCGDWESA